MRTMRMFHCAFNVINALIVALVWVPVLAMSQVPPTRMAATAPRDSLRVPFQSSYALLPSYSYSYSSSPFASGISGRQARFTPVAALVGDTARKSNHRARNTILGAVIGLAAGSFIGARMGAKAHPCGDHECAGPPLGQLFSAIGGGFLGLVAGIVVGAAVSGPA